MKFVFKDDEGELHIVSGGSVNAINNFIKEYTKLQKEYRDKGETDYSDFYDILVQRLEPHFIQFTRSPKVITHDDLFFDIDKPC